MSAMGGPSRSALRPCPGIVFHAVALEDRVRDTGTAEAMEGSGPEPAFPPIPNRGAGVTARIGRWGTRPVLRRELPGFLG